MILEEYIKYATDYLTDKGVLIKYLGEDKDIVIPDSIRCIGAYAFSSKSLTNLTIPSSVEHIGPTAFAQNYLTSIEIPSSVLYIGEEAFFSNPITEVIIYGDPTRFVDIKKRFRNFKYIFSNVDKIRFIYKN